MCGIAGYAGGVLPDLARRMNAAQAHRDPDGQGVFEDPAAALALGHGRLAILDLTPATAQPMYSPDGCYVLVFNGEIYNFADLRHDLIARGHRFTSTGDTEVLLHGLMEYGIAFTDRLNAIAPTPPPPCAVSPPPVASPSNGSTGSKAAPNTCA